MQKFWQNSTIVTDVWNINYNLSILWQRSSSIKMVPKLTFPCFKWLFYPNVLPWFLMTLENVIFIFQSSLPCWIFRQIKSATKKAQSFEIFSMHFPFLAIRLPSFCFSFFKNYFREDHEGTSRTKSSLLNFELQTELHKS